MPLIKQPFRSYTTEPHDPMVDGRILNIRLSASEYIELVKVMKLLHISQDSAAFKSCFNVGKNVLFNTVGADFLAWVSNPSRRINESKLDRLSRKLPEDVSGNQKEM